MCWNYIYIYIYIYVHCWFIYIYIYIYCWINFQFSQIYIYIYIQTHTHIFITFKFDSHWVLNSSGLVSIKLNLVNDNRYLQKMIIKSGPSCRVILINNRFQKDFFFKNFLNYSWYEPIVSIFSVHSMDIIHSLHCIIAFIKFISHEISNVALIKVFVTCRIKHYSKWCIN